MPPPSKRQALDALFAKIREGWPVEHLRASFAEAAKTTSVQPEQVYSALMHPALWDEPCALSTVEYGACMSPARAAPSRTDAANVARPHTTRPSHPTRPSHLAHRSGCWRRRWPRDTSLCWTGWCVPLCFASWKRLRSWYRGSYQPSSRVVFPYHLSTLNTESAPRREAAYVHVCESGHILGDGWRQRYSEP